MTGTLDDYWDLAQLRSWTTGILYDDWDRGRLGAGGLGPWGHHLFSGCAGKHIPDAVGKQVTSLFLVWIDDSRFQLVYCFCILLYLYLMLLVVL